VKKQLAGCTALIYYLFASFLAEYPFEDIHHQAPVRNARLQLVYTDKCRKEQPVLGVNP
jgi:hypothetical protein